LLCEDSATDLLCTRCQRINATRKIEATSSFKNHCKYSLIRKFFPQREDNYNSIIPKEAINTMNSTTQLCTKLVFPAQLTTLNHAAPKLLTEFLREKCIGASLPTDERHNQHNSSWGAVIKTITKFKASFHNRRGL